MGKKKPGRGQNKRWDLIVQHARATHLRLDVLRGASESGTLGISFPREGEGSRGRYAAGARHGARNCSGVESASRSDKRGRYDRIGCIVWLL